MMKFVLMAVAVTSCLETASFAEGDAEKRQKFDAKYLEGRDSYGGDSMHLQTLNKTNIRSFQSHEFNATKHLQANDIKEGQFESEDEKMKQGADEVNRYVRGDEMKRRIGEAEDYILDDKGMNFAEHIPQAQGMDGNVDMEAIKKQMRSDGSPYLSKNRFLDADQKLFVVISESMPESLIKSYFEQLENVNTDVTFVMRGTRGDISELMPTINYISGLLVKDADKDPNDPENRYVHNVQINPKLTRRFGVEKVPCVVFVDNYDPIAETYTANEPLRDTENAYLYYGDMNVEYVLKRINQKAKKQGIKNLIAAMRDDYFSGGVR
jgi:type-F conjugative transfer system pilin assembly protein TrbC